MANALDSTNNKIICIHRLSDSISVQKFCDLIFVCTNNEIRILYNTGRITIMCEITRSQDTGFSNLFCYLVYLSIDQNVGL